MEWRVGPDMTEVRVLCIPLKINDGGGRVDTASTEELPSLESDLSESES